MLKHVLNIAGLSCDLVGAVLLSIPMIWDTRKIAHRIVAELKGIRTELYGVRRWRMVTRQEFDEIVATTLAKDRMVIVAGFFIGAFIVIVAAMLYHVGYLRDLWKPLLFAPRHARSSGRQRRAGFGVRRGYALGSYSNSRALPHREALAMDGPWQARAQDRRHRPHGALHGLHPTGVGQPAVLAVESRGRFKAFGGH